MTFRDPAGSVIRRGDRIFRAVNPAGNRDLSAFLLSRTACDLLAAGNLVSTVELSIESATHDLLGLAWSLEESVALYEHSPVWFPSYPYEWPAEMLFAAAKLTLDIAKRALREGFGLKDATPFNLLFDRGRPVFVDLCSFEKRDATDPMWLACGQFERMFLLPLLAAKQLGLDPHFTFSADLDGPDMEMLAKCFRFPRLLHPAVMRLVTIPRLLGRIAELESIRSKLHVRRQVSEAAAKNVLGRLFHDLETKLESVRPSPSKTSAWSGYAPDHDEVRVKSAVVERVLQNSKAGTVLDVGCNTGNYSKMAARLGAKVVALDADAAVTGTLWMEAAAKNLDILPLTVNISRPTPAVGWRNAEYGSFESRARGKFDVVLMLAVLHHIVVNGRIPLEQLFETMAGYTKRTLVLEFVAKDDPMFVRISRGREALFRDYTEQAFEHAVLRYFTIAERHVVSNTRALYILHRR